MYADKLLNMYVHETVSNWVKLQNFFSFQTNDFQIVIVNSYYIYLSMDHIFMENHSYKNFLKN